MHKHDIKNLLLRRWNRFFATTQIQPAINNATLNLHTITSTCKPCTTSAILKTWLYAWTTNSRFGNPSQQCPLCHKPSSDTLRHYYDCPPLSAAARNILNQQFLPLSRDYFFLANDYSMLGHHSRPLLLLNAVHIYCITNTYNTIKHHPLNDVQVTYHSCLKRLLQHDPRLIDTYLLAQSRPLYDHQQRPLADHDQPPTT